ncbi:Cell cycle regulator Mat89Bb [Trinorchestia longiramus]|nr:Cell cycle regulator Mat89Bb [Trinorchestia longiramus]
MSVLSQKTVFVMDHTLAASSGVQLDMESFCKPRVTGGTSSLAHSSHYISVQPVVKSIWTCAVEAITEYCRIVWDTFPGSRFIALTSVGASAVERLNSWHQDQSLNAIMQLLMVLGPARPGTADLLSGCLSALHNLTEATPVQKQKTPPLINKGRIVVVTRLHSDDEAKLYYQKFCDLVSSVNRSVCDENLAIAHVQLVLLSFIGENEHSRVTTGNLSGGGSGVSGEVVEMQCGSSVAAKLCSLVVRHYNLASTTVTGIPMKEEQNASSSANYDVELFHPAEAHAATAGDSSIRSTRQDTDYPTVTLKWSTPRTNASQELHQCSTAFRITSVDVNSRPSSCLTNFLLNGRWVMLEMPKKTPTQHTKVMSHMLAAHGGDIYIHTLLTARTVLEDPPSISEGQGGKVTDYRIPDFAQLIRANVLAPYGKGGLELGRAQLDRHTKHWPITLSQTALFSLGPSIESLTKYIVQSELTDEQVVDCKQVIFSLLKMEVQGDSLNTSHVRTKGLKREDQYKAMWKELEVFLKEHNSSANHQKVYECYLHCHNKESSSGSFDGMSSTQDSVNIDQALEELDAAAVQSRRRNGGSSKRSHSTDSSHNGHKKRRSSYQPLGSSSNSKGGVSLLTMMMQKIKSTEDKSLQFAGRLKADNNVTKLYANFQKEKDKEDGSMRRK